MEDMDGEWVLYRSEARNKELVTRDAAVALLEPKQCIRHVGKDKVEIRSPEGPSLVLQVNGKSVQGVKCSLKEKNALRLEYWSNEGKVIDERRVFKDGTCLEQRLLVVQENQVERPDIHRRYFRKKKPLWEQFVHLVEQQKVRILGYLLVSQLILLIAVPSRLWGSVICAFHAIALCLTFFWSPEQQSSTHSAVDKEDLQVMKKSVSSPQVSRSRQLSGNSSCEKRVDSLPHIRQVKSSRRLSTYVSLPKMSGLSTQALRRAVTMTGRFSSSTSTEYKPTARLCVQDVFVVGVSRMRTRKRGLTWYSEFELKVRTNPQQKEETAQEWTVWHKYSSILEFHKYLEELLETDQSKQSMFTRLVPAIPKRSKSFRFFSSLRTNRQYDDLLRRRHAGLEEFFVRIFGPKSDEKTRLTALADLRVQSFLNVNQNDLDDLEN